MLKSYKVMFSHWVHPNLHYREVVVWADSVQDAVETARDLKDIQDFLNYENATREEIFVDSHDGCGWVSYEA